MTAKEGNEQHRKGKKNLKNRSRSIKDVNEEMDRKGRTEISDPLHSRIIQGAVQTRAI